MIVVGAGPAGTSAAICAASEGVNTLIIEAGQGLVLRPAAMPVFNPRSPVLRREMTPPQLSPGSPRS
ncbi:MAG: FAD-dependent oxidoreductase [Chloroflexi bacterium]|nr:FAD-dependent oxidoreductase [Chloroflexota bacterium]